MPNVFLPFGLRLIDTEGKQPRVRRYTKKTGNAIYPGDAVVATATGDVDIATAGAALLGVAMEFRAATSTAQIAVCDDPEAVFEIQSDNQILAADVFLNSNITATAGDASLLRSKHDLDVASFATTATLQLKILGLSEIGDNAYGSFARIKVKINNHVLKGATGSAGV
jgi:hypothetical protein